MWTVEAQSQPVWSCTALWRNSLQCPLSLYFGLECIRECPKAVHKALVCMLPLGLVPACSFRPNGIKLSKMQKDHRSFLRLAKAYWASWYMAQLSHLNMKKRFKWTILSFKMFSFPINKFKGGMCSSNSFLRVLIFFFYFEKPKINFSFHCLVSFLLCFGFCWLLGGWVLRTKPRDLHMAGKVPYSWINSPTPCCSYIVKFPVLLKLILIIYF